MNSQQRIATATATATLQPGRVLLNAYNGKYVWTGKDGDSEYVEDMAIEHLFYAARMLYNHTVPPAFRVLGAGESMNRYADIFSQSIKTKSDGFLILTEELYARRDELPPDLKAQLEDIGHNRKFLNGNFGEDF